MRSKGSSLFSTSLRVSFHHNRTSALASSSLPASYSSRVVRQDSPEYVEKRKALESLFTIYGRQAVFESLSNPELHFRHVLVTSTLEKDDVRKRKGGLVNDIVEQCRTRNIPVRFMSSDQISRISKNGALAQGVVADIVASNVMPHRRFLDTKPSRYTLLALDGVTTQRNVGMVLRVCAAAGCGGVIFPSKGVPPPNDPLVVRSSCGTVFKTAILKAGDLASCLADFVGDGAKVRLLDAHGTRSLFEIDVTHPSENKVVYVFGSESSGISETVRKGVPSHEVVSIPMLNNVESLNISTAAALVCYHHFPHKMTPRL